MVKFIFQIERGLLKAAPRSTMECAPEKYIKIKEIGGIDGRFAIHETSPIKKIIGLFKINNIIEDSPRALWDELKEQAGISEDEFFDYFRDKEMGFALEINY